MSDGPPKTTAEVARVVGVPADTLRRWVKTGVIPEVDQRAWTPAQVAHARIVARLRERGHSLQEIREATREGKLAFAFIEDLLPPGDGTYTVKQAAKETGLEPALIERIFATMGFNAAALDRLGADDVQLLRYLSSVLTAGFPLVALLQLVRVYGQALAQIADAEVRLFHLYVHEPLMRDGIPGIEMAEEMEGLARELLPLASPIMDHVHQPLPAALRRAGRHRPHGGRLRRDVARPGAHARRDRLRRPRRLHAADRGGGRGGGRRRGRALPGGGRQHAARRCARHQDDRRRGDDRRPRTPARSSTGPSASSSSGRSARCRASASTRRRRSTATATTTAARSTSPPASPRARRAARSW